VRIESVVVSAGARQATLALEQLQPGFVYELRLKPLVPAGQTFFPAEAHYTLRQIPR